MKEKIAAGLRVVFDYREKPLMAEIDRLKAVNKELREDNTRLLKAAQRAYRKHHLDDPDIGWEQLGDDLCNALCNVMGDDGFQKWLAEQKAKGGGA